MKYFSLFSGIGGFELGIERAIEGAECVGYSEIDKYAIEIYQKHYKEHKNYGDITTINTAELPDFELLVGGFPCQAFSIAGKRRGFDDTRGTLFFDVARILKDKRPRYFILENVKGLLNHGGGQTFQTILEVLADIGYEYQWQVLNSKDFAVPQNRERVLIVGHLRGESRPEVFPIGQPNPNYLKQVNKPKHSNDRIYASDGLSPTLNTMQGGRRQPKVMAVLTPDRVNKRQRGRRFKNEGEPSFTLNTQDRHGVMIANTIDANYYKGINRNPGHASSNRGYNINGRIRRLTPLECERLQAFPDGWTEGISDSQRYKVLGNAVTVNVIQAVAERL